MSKLQGEVLTLPKIGGSLCKPKMLSGNIGAKTINIGGKGDDGATFTPSVSADGIISWTNDKEFPNPEPVNIKGKDGKDGQDGTSPVVSVSSITGGHRITITDANGTKTATVKDGQDGKDGYTPVKYKDYFTEADKVEIVSDVISALPKYDGEVVAV